MAKVFIHPEFNQPMVPISESVETPKEETTLNPMPKENSQPLPNLDTPEKITAPLKYSSSLPESKPISFQTTQSIEALTEHLTEKYDDFKLEETEQKEKIDYSFQNRDCQYSGSLNKKGHGHIQIKNTGDWTQKDVDDLVEHLHNDVGTKKIKFDKSSIEPICMLLVACEALQEKGISVKIFNQNSTQSVEEFKKEVDDLYESSPQEIRFNDFPSEIQEFKKLNKIEMVTVGEKSSSDKGEAKEKLEDTIALRKKELSFLNEWSDENSEHPSMTTANLRVDFLTSSILKSEETLASVLSGFEHDVEEIKKDERTQNEAIRTEISEGLSTLKSSILEKDEDYQKAKKVLDSCETNEIWEARIEKEGEDFENLLASLSV